MARTFQERFDKEISSSEGFQGLGAGTFKCGRNILKAADDPDSSPTTTGGCFKKNGKTDTRGLFYGLFSTLYRFGCASRHRYACLLCDGTGGYLISQPVDRVGCGADKDNPFLFATADELGVLAQIAPARMNRLTVIFFGRCNDRFDIQEDALIVFASKHYGVISHDDM